MLNLEKLTQAVGELEEDTIFKMLNEFVAGNPSEEEALAAVTACQEGMEIVGDLFDKGDYFVGDLIFAGELLKDAINILKPVIGSKQEHKLGSIVLATVHGDLHDIGKNIFKSMAEAAGFEVHDLGIDQPVNAIVDKVKEVKPDIVGMSGVLTLSLDSIKDTVDGLKKAGLRDNIKIIIGGNPVTKEACKNIGANSFTTNAAEGVRTCQKWVS